MSSLWCVGLRDRLRIVNSCAFSGSGLNIVCVYLWYDKATIYINQVYKNKLGLVLGGLNRIVQYGGATLCFALF